MPWDVAKQASRKQHAILKRRVRSPRSTASSIALLPTNWSSGCTHLKKSSRAPPEVAHAVAGADATLVPLELQSDPVELPDVHAGGLGRDAKTFDERAIGPRPTERRHTPALCVHVTHCQHDVKGLALRVPDDRHARVDPAYLAVPIDQPELMIGEVGRAQRIGEGCSEGRCVVRMNGAR